MKVYANELEQFKSWFVAGSMQHPSEPNRVIDGFDVYVEIGNKKYRINSKELEQFKIVEND